MIKCHRKADSESETESLISSDRNNYASINRNNDLNNSFSQQFIDNNPIQTSFLFNRNIRIPNSNGLQNNKFSFYKLWKYTGPGLLISVAYLDPGNLESDLQDGALSGYKLLWVILYSTIAGFFIQLLSVKLGSATGLQLAEICHREYDKFTRLFLWIMIEIAIIASDIQQVIGSAVALNLLTNGYLPMWAAILITCCDVFIFLLLENTGIRVIEAIFAVVISIMGCSFLYMYIVAKPDQISVIEGVFIPWCSNCSSFEVRQLMGIVGSIVMPHNIFFHSTLVLSRDFDRQSDIAINEANKYYSIELAIAFFIAFICNLFVTSVSSKSFHGTAQAANVTLQNAGQFISQQYGMSMKIIWAIGLFSAGQCSTVTSTYAGQFIMEGFTKINLKRWLRIIITRSISIVPCLIVTLSSYNSVDKLIFWCNLIQAIQLPFALMPILHFTSSKRIMGSFRVKLPLKLLCCLITACVLVINIYFSLDLILQNRKVWSYVIGIFLIIYLIFVTFFLLGVNNIYRIKLIFRNLLGPHDPTELDELLHTKPIYRRPERTRQTARSSTMY